MHSRRMGEFGWTFGLALALAPCVSVTAAQTVSSPQLAIGNPLPNALIAGRVSMSVAYSVGTNRITAYTVMVDDKILYSRPVTRAEARGIHYLEVDTRTIADGSHTLKVIAMGERGALATDAVDLTIRNGVPGGLDLVPPLVQFRGLTDGQDVSGKITLDLMAEDNSTMDLLVSIFVNQRSAFIKNRPPYSMEIDTAQFLDPATGSGLLRVEAWAYDTSNNLGKSRILSLNVRPVGASENQTPAKPDPTRRSTSLVMPVDMGLRSAPAPLPANVESTLVIPLGGRMSMPPTRIARSQVNGPSLNPMDRATAIPKAPRPMPIRSDMTAPLLAPGKITPPMLGAVPVPGRRRPSANTPAVPEPLRIPEMAPRLAASRNLLPPAAAPTPSAVLPPVGAPPEPQPIRIQAPSANAPKLSPTRIAITIPSSSSAPVTARPVSPGSLRSLPMPGVEAEGPVVAVVDTKARPGKNGKSPVDLYRVRPSLPQDVDYKVGVGETIGKIAKKFRVSPRAVMLANGIDGPMKLRAGSTIKLPGTFDVIVDNRRVAFDVSPRVEAGLPLAPFRHIFEHTGGVVVYFPEAHEVRASNEKAEVKLQLGSKQALVNQMVMVMDRAAFVEGGRTLVPVGFLEQALELKAEYDVKSGTISLLRK